MKILHGHIRWRECAFNTALAILGIIVAVAFVLFHQCGCSGRSGIEVAPEQEACGETAQAGVVNLSDLRADTTGIEDLRADIAAVRSDIGTVRAEQKAGRDAVSVVKQNNPWPLVACVALMSPSPAAGLVAWIRKKRRGRSPP